MRSGKDLQTLLIAIGTKHNGHSPRLDVKLESNMLPDVEAAVRLHDIDGRIAVLQKEIAALPKHIAEIEKKLSSHERRLEIDRSALSANQKERKRLEGEIQLAEGKISKLRGQALEAKNNDHYRAFQNEIDYATKEIRGNEDRILELMTASEPLDANVKAAEAALKEERKHVDAEKAEAEKSVAGTRKALESLMAARQQTLATMSPAIVTAYERIRKARAGIAVSEALDGRCRQCHITLRPQFMQELKRGEKVMFCESCTRMLYWNPPKSVEALAGMNAVSAK
jgi:predicted  nucleic acid-binding Zn-ribbon protein